MQELSDSDFAKTESEQRIIQAEKFQGRSAKEYDESIFLGRLFPRDHRTSEVEDFLKREFGDGTTSLKNILEALIERKGSSIRWIDMGGGRGLALRQMALTEKLRGNVEMVNVDLNDLDLADLPDRDSFYLEKKFPGISKDDFKPRFMRGNATTIQLSEPADLITSIEMIQYLDHPVAALCNWYNQLAPDGLLIVSTEHKWSGWVRYTGTILTSDPHPMADILTILKKNDIPFAVSKDSYLPGREPGEDLSREFVNLIIKKVPDTSLIPSSPVKEIWYNPHYYKAVYYKSNAQPIEVLHSNGTPPSFNQRYSEQLLGAKRSGNLTVKTIPR